jgi:hypothetical protein
MQPEPGETSKVVMSTGVRKYDRSRDIRSESYLLTRVGVVICKVLWLRLSFGGASTPPFIFRGARLQKI